MYRVLIAEADDQLGQSLERLVMDQGCRVVQAVDASQALGEIQNNPPDLVLLSATLPPAGGLEFLSRLKQSEPHLPVIVTAASGATSETIEATKLGAFDYVALPFEPGDMAALLRSGLEAGRFMRSPVKLDSDQAQALTAGDALLGRSRPMLELYKAIGRAAATDSTVLIQGESGTGKELVARALFQHSTRAGKPFVVVNCVAIPETLLESELFGYEKGAFTGAAARRIGKIEQADGGTVFLDEIGDMPLAIQAKMLRLLQERSVERIGGRRPLPVDVRIIAATNRDLEKAVQEGSFREDLYFRLKVVTLALPSLRERRDDIPLLARHFLSLHSQEMELPNPGIAPEGEAALLRYPWPGNVRELSNCLQKAIIFSKGAPLSDKEIESSLRQPSVPDHSMSAEAGDMLLQWARDSLLSSQADKPYEAAMDAISSMLIQSALEMTEGNKTRAAKLLGLTRPTLLAKIDKHRLAVSAKVTGPKTES
eukprot:TRINITY_DN1619_c1_g1_i3.p4 TRINITY_DN1619_c1_g1~~TRINITY_DN1619_c1_g1_i3.p4  ORF type:complete len:483 (+),score=191.78 TRINITY_DN1619_c1_g1_i3:1274-2722(+)